MPKILKPYVPCLRWKRGEYQAVYRTTDMSKDQLTPLIEIPEIGFDFETRQPTKTIDDHLEPMGRRILSKWGKEICLIDFRLIPMQERMANGEHPITYLFRELREKDIHAIPVIRIDDDPKIVLAVAEFVASDNFCLSLRLDIAALARSDIKHLLQQLLTDLMVSVEDVIIIVDLGAPNFEPLPVFADLIKSIYLDLPFLEDWSEIVILGTSFPPSMVEVSMGLNRLQRHEWILYELLIEKLQQQGIRIPIYGDYTINHPDLLQLDMRIMKPSASLRYTIDKEWLIVKGKNVRDHRYDQYQDICRQVVESPFFCGAEFSAGDKYIEDCANGVASTGNLTTWREVGTNHHIQRIVTDLANNAAE